MTAVATRAHVKPSSLEMCRESSLPAERDHEKMVAAFMAQAEATDPARYIKACEMNPVLSESAQRDIRAREISAFSPAQEANGGVGFSEVHGIGSVFPTGSVVTIDDIESVNATVEAALKAPPLAPGDEISLESEVTYDWDSRA